MRVARYASLLSVAEVGLGSLIHAAQLPLGGHWLSLNQGIILTLAAKHEVSRHEAVRTVNSVSLVASLFKALSPAGKRLTPMLAICVQGLGMASGLALLGRNLAGVALGLVLLSLWGFAQPLLIAYLLFGKSWFQGLQKIWLDVAAWLHLNPEIEWWILGAVILAKVVLALVIAVAAWRGKHFETRYEAQIARWRENLPLPLTRVTGPVSKWRLVLRDLTSLPYLLAVAFGFFFFFYSGERNAQGVWQWILRPLLAGAVFFWMLRSVPPSFWNSVLRRFPSLGATYREAFRSRTSSS